MFSNPLKSKKNLHRDFERNYSPDSIEDQKKTKRSSAQFGTSLRTPHGTGRLCVPAPKGGFGGPWIQWSAEFGPRVPQLSAPASQFLANSSK